MFSRLKGMGIISTCFVIISIYYYEKIISQTLLLRPKVAQISEVYDIIRPSNNLTEINL